MRASLRKMKRTQNFVSVKNIIYNTDEESSSMVFLTKQQLGGTARGSIRQTNVGQFEGNTKELSRIEDVERSNEISAID